MGVTVTTSTSFHVTGDSVLKEEELGIKLAVSNTRISPLALTLIAHGNAAILTWCMLRTGRGSKSAKTT